MTKICPNCKNPNPDTADFCQSCGQDLGGAVNTSTQTSQGGAMGWWNKQSTGGKAAIGIAGICCIGLILIIAFAGFGSHDQTTSTNSNTNTATTPSTPNTNTTNQNTNANYIEFSYPDGTWDGSITIRTSSSNENEINFDGSGTKKFDLNSYKGADIYVMAQKQDGGSGKLSIVVVKNGVTKFNSSTTEGYGIVSGWIFSYQ